MSEIDSSPQSTLEKPPLPMIVSQMDKILCETKHRGEHLAMCLSKINDMLQVVNSKPANQRHDDVLRLASTLLHPLVKTIYISISKKDDLQNYYNKLISILINILGLMERKHFEYYFESFPNRQELSEFIKSLLFLFLSILTSDNNEPLIEDLSQSMEGYQDNEDASTFPACHTSEMILRNYILAKSLTSISDALRLNFRFQNFQQGIWIDYLKCSFSLATHKTLQMEDMSESQRNKFLAYSGDIRLLILNDIKLAWDSISSSLESLQKLNNELLGPLLQILLLRKEEIRSTVAQMFLKMIQAEYARQTTEAASFDLGSRSELFQSNQSMNNSIYGRCATDSSSISESHRCSFQDFLKETVTHLHKFLEVGLGHTDCRISFSMNGTSSVTSSLAVPIFYESQLTHQVHLYESAINGLIQLMLDLRCVEDNVLLQISCILRLLDFFENVIDHKDLFVYYLYKLYCIHVKTNNSVEAGFVLLRHAKLLHWSDEAIDNHHNLACHAVVPHKIGSQVTERRLKEILYLNILDLFEEGQLWEAGLPLCRELCMQYEGSTFEYSKLSKLLLKMSIFYEKIMESYLRPEPSYFRVSLYGKGFPLFLRSSTLIFRGAAYENLGDFQGRIMMHFCGSKIVPFIGPPGPEITDSEERYIQIIACQPVMHVFDRFNGQQVDNRISNFYKTNDVNKFMYTRKVKSPPIVSLVDINEDRKQLLSKNDDEFANLWREKIILQTQHKLPGLSYFFPVTCIETLIVSPIENAIEDLITANTRLERILQNYLSNAKEDVRALSQQLTGMIDAAVNGGITKYEQAFFSDNNLAGPAELDHKRKLKGLIAAQVPLLEKGLAIHNERVVDEMRPLHSHLEESFQKLKAHILNMYGNYSKVNNCNGRRSRSTTLKLRTNRMRSPMHPSADSISKDNTPSSPRTPSGINSYNSLSLIQKPSNLNSSNTRLSQLRSSSVELRPTTDHEDSSASNKEDDSSKTLTNSVDTENTVTNLSTGCATLTKEGIHKYLKDKFKCRRSNINGSRLNNKYSREQASLSQFYGDVLDDDTCTMSSLSNNFVRLTTNSAYDDSDNEIEANDDQLFLHQLWERSNSVDTLNATNNCVETNATAIPIKLRDSSSSGSSINEGASTNSVVASDEIRLPPIPFRTSPMCQQYDKPPPIPPIKQSRVSLSPVNNNNEESKRKPEIQQRQQSFLTVSYNNDTIGYNRRHSDNCYSATDVVQLAAVATLQTNKNKSLSGHKPLNSNKIPPTLPPKPSRVT